MLAALLCAALCTLSQDPAVLLVRVLDVSDARMGGDAILVTDSAAGRARHVLIDASDRGRTVVARLAAFRVDTLALVILSHPHADHYGGLSAVLRRFPVRRFVYGGTPRTAVSYRALLHQIDSLRIPVVTADTGVRRLTLVTRRDTVELALLAPPRHCRTLAPAEGRRGQQLLGGRAPYARRLHDALSRRRGAAGARLVDGDRARAAPRGRAEGGAPRLGQLDQRGRARRRPAAGGDHQRQRPPASVRGRAGAARRPGHSDLLHRRRGDGYRTRAAWQAVDDHDAAAGDVSRADDGTLRADAPVIPALKGGLGTALS